MTAKLTKDQMRQMRLYNSYDIARAAKNKIYITYAPASTGLAANYAYWMVVGIGTKTDKDGWWYHHGHKVFTVHGRDEKPTVLKEAMDWCHHKYGTLGFERDSFGGYQVMGTMRRILMKKGAKHG